MQTTKKLLFAIRLPVLCMALAAHAQPSDFETWKQSQQKGFEAYLNEQQQAFAAMLRSNWKEYSSQLSVRENYSPKPNTPPNALPDLPAPREPQPKESVPNRPHERANGKSLNMKPTLVFLGHELAPPSWPVKLSPPFDNKEALARSYETLATHAASSQLVSWLERQRRDLQLGDWGIWQLANLVAEGSGPEKSVKVWFLLIELGYDVKLGFNSDRVVVLPQIQQQVYWKRYYTSAERRYYDLNQETADSSRLLLHGETKADRKPFDLSFTQIPRTKPDVRTMTLVNGNDRLELSYDAELARYYHKHPTIPLSHYFNAPLGPFLEKSLRESWQRLNSQQSNDLASLNRLLGLVQYGVTYKLDSQQFNTEEYYQLPEELLANGAGDCEDRAILFARMIRYVMNHDVIGVHYPGHVATAVNIPGDGTMYELDNVGYLAADPTYIGSKAGEVMPKLRNTLPSFIR